MCINEYFNSVFFVYLLHIKFEMSDTMYQCKMYKMHKNYWNTLPHM